MKPTRFDGIALVALVSFALGGVCVETFRRMDRREPGLATEVEKLELTDGRILTYREMGPHRIAIVEHDPQVGGRPFLLALPFHDFRRSAALGFDIDAGQLVFEYPKGGRWETIRVPMKPN